MTCNERVTALAHLVTGVGVQIVVAGMFWLATGSWTVGAWAGATCAATLFYSRELNQAERRAGNGQADRHLRADGLTRHPLRELIHHKAHTLMPAVESHG